MQISNGTDETVVLRPGECLSGDTTHHSFNGKEYRLEIDSVNRGPSEASEFTTPIERHIGKYNE